MNKLALNKISYGMYVVSSRSADSEKINAFLGNSCVQITANPISIAVSVNKENLTSDFINESKVFTISVITESAKMEFIGHFGFRSGKNFDKFSKQSPYEYKIGKNGCPIILSNTNAFLEVLVKDTLDAGSHIIFLGNITESEILNEDISMTYKFYHEVLKGKTSKKAATYVSE